MKLSTRAAVGALTVALAAQSAPVAAQRRVLVYTGRASDTPSMTRAVDMLRARPELQSGPARPEFTLASDAMWRSLTRADFARYNALWIDGANCTISSPTQAEGVYAAVAETRDVWSSAITGHFEIIGSDSDLHLERSPGAARFVVNSYHYVTSGAGTGLFASVGCIFYEAPVDTPVPWLQGIGDFRVTGDGCSDGQVLEPGAERHPLHLGVSPPSSTLVLPSDLAWGCFTHSHFNRHPPSFQRIYSIGSGEGSGVVIVNDRGGCVVDADCVRGQFCNRDPMGGDPSCRPTLGLGRSCSAGSQCTSGVCAQGVCCDRACNGACERCALAASTGLCTALPAGTRPSPGCVCDGRSNVCALPDAPPPDVVVDAPVDRVDMSVDVARDAAADSLAADAGDECVGWRCGRDLRLDGRAGPLGGCGCRAEAPSTGAPWLPAMAGLALGRLLRRRRARRP